jgi:Holliday junction DNA helicase RuvB
MAREPILGRHLPEDDEDRDLRPQRMSEMVGQLDVAERLRIALDAAQKRDEPLGHILFDGPPGLGKTTFARCIPSELGVDLQIAAGAWLKAPKDLIPYLTNLAERSILFIDEIHRIPRTVEEFLYTAMEDFRIDIILGEGVNARTLNMPLKAFTLIGATTRAGMLSGPLRERFHMKEHLGFYTVDELCEIVRRNSAKLKMTIQDDAAREVAGRSRSTPRVANNLLRWVRDYADSRAGGNVTLEVSRAALKMAGVDAMGLDTQDRRYLETIIRVFGGGPAGIEAIAHTMNVASDTLTEQVEPFLLRSELVIRTPRGRMVTTQGLNHLQIAAPSADTAAEAQRKLF